MSSKSNESRRSRKPESATDKPPKPYPEFPLGPANNGRWCKKIKGTIHYFGRWGKVVNGVMTRIAEDGCWQDALAIYKAQVDDIQAGHRPRKPGEAAGLTVKEMCNRFLTAKLHRLESREIAPRTFSAYREATDLLIATFGKNTLVDDLNSEDFEKLRAKMASKWGPVRLGCEIVRIKTVFRFCRKADMVDPEFKKPSKHVMRKHRASTGRRPLRNSPAALRKIRESAAYKRPECGTTFRLSLSSRTRLRLSYCALRGTADGSPVARMPIAKGREIDGSIYYRRRTFRHVTRRFAEVSVSAEDAIKQGVFRVFRMF